LIDKAPVLTTIGCKGGHSALLHSVGAVWSKELRRTKVRELSLA